MWFQICVQPSGKSSKWKWGCPKLSQYALKIHPTSLLKPLSLNNLINNLNIKQICLMYPKLSRRPGSGAQLASYQKHAGGSPDLYRLLNRQAAGTARCSVPEVVCFRSKCWSELFQHITFSDLMPTGKYCIIQELRGEVYYYAVILFICSKVLLPWELTLLLTATEIVSFTTWMCTAAFGQIVTRAASKHHWLIQIYRDFS